MKLSTTTMAMARVEGDDFALREIAKAGFDAVDFSMFAYSAPEEFEDMDEKEFTQYFSDLGKKAREYGIEIGQTHAPFPTVGYGEGFDNERSFRRVVKSIYATALLGCEYDVIHPPILPERKYDRLADENLNEVYEVYSRLIPHLRAAGVKLAVENMFNYDSAEGKICPTICSHSSEMAKIVDTLGDCFVNCLDIGHAHLTGMETPAEMIRALGHDRLKTLHVHDNDGKSDLHTAPYEGIIEWDPICIALGEINYDGTFSFEADSFLCGYDDDIKVLRLRLMHDVGRYLISKTGL